MTLNQLIYRVTRPLGGLKVARFLSRNHPKILMYHRITDDPEGEGIPVEQFKRQVEIIRKHFNPLTLRELMKAHEERRVPKHAVCVTFDDGYADFGEIAFPILKEAGVPATLFVTTGFVNGDLWLWPDKIRWGLSNTNTKIINFGDEIYNLSVCDGINLAWSDIGNYCIALNNELRIKFIDSLFEDLQLRCPAKAPEEYRAMSWSALNEIINFGFDVESHSHTHPILSKINEAELGLELQESKLKIKEMLGIDSEAFCYPNGMPNDINNYIVRKLAEVGYKYGVVAYPGIKPTLDSFNINRYPGTNSIDEFIKTVYGYKFISMRINKIGDI